MNLFHLLNGNTALVLAVLSGFVQPFFSALLTHSPSFLTGVLTTLQAAVAGFLAEWAAAPNHFDWKQAVVTSLGAWVIGLAVHNGWIKQTDLQDSLHERGLQLGPKSHARARKAV